MTVSIEQAQLSLKELIEKTTKGESVVITQGNLPVAELRSVTFQTQSRFRVVQRNVDDRGGR